MNPVMREDFGGGDVRGFAGMRDRERRKGECQLSVTEAELAAIPSRTTIRHDTFAPATGFALFARRT